MRAAHGSERICEPPTAARTDPPRARRLLILLKDEGLTESTFCTHNEKVNTGNQFTVHIKLAFSLGDEIMHPIRLLRAALVAALALPSPVPRSRNLCLGGCSPTFPNTMRRAMPR